MSPDISRGPDGDLEVIGKHGSTTEQQDSQEESPAPAPSRGWRFWILFPTLCLSGLAVTMEGSIVVTALPSISRSLHTTDYVWVTNAYTFASTIFQPLTGWLAEIFGRKPLMLSSIVLFGVGSGIAGAANSLAVILVGRLIQGIGGGGVPLVAELIVSDVVPLPERPQMLGMVMATSCLGLLLGPVLGGIIVNNTTWRWIFWINCPIAAAALLCMFPVLGQRTKEQRHATKQLSLSVGRFDWIGNVLLPASSLAILLPLTMGGKMFAWSSFRTILPLVLGVCGFTVFGLYEKFFCAHPVIPPRLLANFPALCLQLQNFIQSMVIMWINYYLIIYFQAVHGRSSQQAGFELMPSIVGMVVFAIAGGVVSSMLKTCWKTLIMNVVAFSLISLGLGIFHLLDANTSTAVHAVLQIIVAAGNGVLMSTLLPAVQSYFTQDDVWSVTSLFNYLRNFAFVWGVTIPSIIFDQTVDRNIDLVPPQFHRDLLHGGAYAHASKSFVQSFQGTAREQVVALYTVALRATWWGSMSFALLGLVLVLLQHSCKR